MCKTGRAYAYRTRVRVRTTSAGRLGVLIWNEMKGYLYINISKGYRCIEGIYIYIYRRSDLVLTSGERVHQALVRVGRDVCVGGLFWLANLRVAFSEF